MRLLLDVHISGRNSAAATRERGHDVRAANEEHDLDRLDDPDLLEVAAQDRRVLITGHIEDFVPVTQAWAVEDRHHAGIILIPHHIQYGQFGRIIAGLLNAFTLVPSQDDWLDRVHYLK